MSGRGQITIFCCLLSLSNVYLLRFCSECRYGGFCGWRREGDNGLTFSVENSGEGTPRWINNGTLSELWALLSLCQVWGAGKTKWELGSLKRLQCPTHNEANFVANFKQLMEILRETDETVATPEPHFGDVSMTSQELYMIGSRRYKPLHIWAWLGDCFGTRSLVCCIARVVMWS